MESKNFTAGPWDIEYDLEKSPNIWIHAASNAGVAKVEVCDYGDGLGHRLTREDHANAHLIASAPELYEALKGVIAVSDRKTVEYDSARAAIAKAEGRS